MSRLIDADELIVDARLGEEYIPHISLRQIENAPTVDAVEVVRCKDCCYHEDEEPNMVYCPNIVGGWVQNDFFCKDGSRGERK